MHGDTHPVESKRIPDQGIVSTHTLLQDEDLNSRHLADKTWRLEKGK